MQHAQVAQRVAFALAVTQFARQVQRGFTQALVAGELSLGGTSLRLAELDATTQAGLLGEELKKRIWFTLGALIFGRMGDRIALTLTAKGGRPVEIGRFSQAMRRQADQIVVVSRFKFGRDQTLETRLSTPGAERP